MRGRAGHYIRASPWRTVPDGFPARYTPLPQAFQPCPSPWGWDTQRSDALSSAISSFHGGQKYQRCTMLLPGAFYPGVTTPRSSRAPERGHGLRSTLAPRSSTPAPRRRRGSQPWHVRRRQGSSTASKRSSAQLGQSGEGRKNHHPEPHPPAEQKTAGFFPFFFFKLPANTSIQRLGELRGTGPAGSEPPSSSPAPAQGSGKERQD